MTNHPVPGGESSSHLKLVKGSKPCTDRLTTKTERATSFLEDAYDGAQARIEVLEERCRALHRMVCIMANSYEDQEAAEVLASMPADPTAL